MTQWIPITQKYDTETEVELWESETVPEKYVRVWLHYIEAGIEQTELACLGHLGEDEIYWLTAGSDYDTGNIILPGFNQHDRYIAWCEAVAPKYEDAK